MVKKLNLMNWLKNLTILKPLILVIQLKKLTITQKICEIQNKIFDHNYDKYIAPKEFNKLTSENFAARLTQGKLTTKVDIADIVKKTDFNEKL